MRCKTVAVAEANVSADESQKLLLRPLDSQKSAAQQALAQGKPGSASTDPNRVMGKIGSISSASGLALNVDFAVARVSESMHLHIRLEVYVEKSKIDTSRHIQAFALSSLLPSLLPLYLPSALFCNSGCRSRCRWCFLTISKFGIFTHLGNGKVFFSWNPFALHVAIVKRGCFGVLCTSELCQKLSKQFSSFSATTIEPIAKSSTAAHFYSMIVLDDRERLIVKPRVNCHLLACFTTWMSCEPHLDICKALSTSRISVVGPLLWWHNHMNRLASTLSAQLCDTLRMEFTELW